MLPSRINGAFPLLSQSQSDYVRQWLHVKAQADKLAEQERAMRETIVKGLWGNADDGTHRLDLGGGYELKVILGTRLSLAEGTQLDNAVQAIRNSEYSGLIPDLFKWKPSLVSKAWKTAPAEVRRLLTPSVTSTPNAPQLTLEMPKS